MIRILVFPQKETPQNSYLGNITSVISDEYTVVGVNEAIKRKWGSLFFYDVVHLNWLENIRGKSRIKVWMNFIFRFATLIYFRLRGKPIIWTIHNKEVHGQELGKSFSRIMMRSLLKWSTRIHILCDATFDEIPALEKYRNKVVCIPHGDYIQNYPKSDLNIREKYGIAESKKIVLFCGKIDPYKNIDVLVRAFEQSNIGQSDFVLLVCGSCRDLSYRNKIEQAAQGNENIILDFNFIPVDQMEAYLTQSLLLVAPYDKRCTLNSGTLWMAFSYGKTMICPEIGCIRDVLKSTDAVYSYDYDSAQSHEDSLISVFKQVKEDFADGKLRIKEQNAFDYIEKRSWKNYKKSWISLYHF
ncbi:glycosyltransferase family 4 protein [Fibrobacter sp. UWB12]|uniref:glycosyltransferase family 4 protein n=1 Tax=Fibrobacter sp. UWB12 TaxID=1896203 RepID=UPI00091F59D0|nr:glycosyltransferase family 4 protein [Fibrobacter sp. UWB12]SHK76091.1 Glycosyltransferase involved in cell wall bisynthesis [Fibrobacter sp. UWB12]